MHNALVLPHTLLAVSSFLPSFLPSNASNAHRSNVSNAMGLHAHPLLSHVRLLLLQDPRTLYKAIEALQPIASKGPVGHLLKFDNALIQAIAKGNNCLQSIAS